MNGVFEGGGCKGIGLVGALAAWEDESAMPPFDRVAGTSVGAIVAALYLAGYTPAELKDELLKTDLDDFIDPPLTRWLSALWRLGYCKGEALQHWVGKLLERKGITTFDSYPPGKELYVIATNLQDRDIVVLARSTHPQVPVALAVRMSTALPPLFEPVRWQDHLMVDGGLLSNYPLWVFKDLSGRTVGFKLVPDAPKKRKKVRTAFGFFWRIFTTLRDASGREDRRMYYWSYTIHIPSCGVRTTDFRLDNEKKLELWAKGRDATHAFLRAGGSGLFTEKFDRDEVEAMKRKIAQIFDGLPPAYSLTVTDAPVPEPPNERLEVTSARARLEQALLLTDKQADLAPYLAKLAAHALVVQDYQQAISDCERAVRIDPQLFEAHHRLGNALAYYARDLHDADAKSMHLARARATLEAAVKLPGRGHTTDTLQDLAWILDEEGQPAEAVKLYEKAQGQVPPDDRPAFHYNYAVSLGKSGRQEEALDMLSRVPSDLRAGARHDRDFNALRNQPWKARFDELTGP